MEAGQRSSDGKVSGSVIPSKKEVYFFCGSVWMNYLFVRECLYSMRGTVTCLVTVPIIEEFERFGGNFHNCHGSYIIRDLHSTTVVGLDFQRLFRAQQPRLSFTNGRMRLFWTSMILLPFFSLDNLYGRDMTRWIFITPSIAPSSIWVV